MGIDADDYDTISEMIDNKEVDITDLDEDVISELVDSGLIDMTDTENYEEAKRIAQERYDAVSEPYICPECFEPYDGIYCENCGHSNDDIGYEEVSDEEKWFEDMTAIAMFDAEDRKNIDGGFFGDGFDDEEDY